MNTSNLSMPDMNLLSLEAKGINQWIQEQKSKITALETEQHQLEWYMQDSINTIKQILAEKIPEISKMLDSAKEHTPELLEIQKTQLAQFWEELIRHINEYDQISAEEFFRNTKYNPYRVWAGTDIENIMCLVYPPLSPIKNSPEITVSMLEPNSQEQGKLVFLGEHSLHYLSLTLAKPFTLENKDDYLTLTTSAIPELKKEAQRFDVSQGMSSVTRLLISYLSKEEYKNLTQIAVLRVKLGHLQPQLGSARQMLKNYQHQKQKIELKLTAIQEQITTIQKQLDGIFQESSQKSTL